MHKVLGWITGGVVTLVLTLAALHYYAPPLPFEVDLKVTFAERNLSEIEPLVVTGESQTGDFIFVRFLDSSTVQFGYDRWGVGGPVSAPITIEPRRSYGLKLHSPSLASVRGSASSVPPRIRIEFEGRVVLEGEGRYDFRAGRHAWFGENPLVGSSCGPRFSGTLSWEGQVLRGSVRRTLTRSQVIAAWFKAGYWQVIGVALAGLMAGWLTARVARDRGVACRGWIRAHSLAPHRWFMITAAVCAAGFWWLVTAGTGRLLVPETFGSFYDYQAASLLQGRLDVPEPGIGGEAFIVAGKYYGYFGILPALLRLPFVVYDVAFGEIIRSAMLGYFVGCLIAAYALLCWAARQREPTATPSALATVLFTLSVGLGSTLLFLGSRAYIYHEAILAGAMFALGSAVFALHWLEKPDSRAWIAALVCGTLAVQTRPTPGLFALSLLGVTAIAVGLQTGRIRRTLLVGLLACLGILSFNAMSYLKFRTLDGSPFKYSVQYSAARRARFEDKNFHLVNIPRNFDTYVTRANFRLEKGFPWFYPDDRKRPSYPKSKFDLAEMTVALPFAMPALFGLTILGSAWGWWRVRALRRPLLVLALGATPMIGALLAAIVTSHRYTGDFCPWMIATAALAVAGIEATAAPGRKWLLSGLTVLTAVSIFVNAAIALSFQGEMVWGVDKETQSNYQHLRARIDGWLGVDKR